MSVVFRAVLASPRFLFLDELPGRSDDWALASRLFYFLWSSPPDQPLRDLAAEGTLHEPGRPCAGRSSGMLASPRSRAFVENFVGQWLELRQIDFTQPDKKLYPEFDDILRASMLDDTEEFAAQLLREDGKLTNFVHSDFLMINRRLAEHYRVEGVIGEEIRRFPLPPGCHRGGVLTQASVLKVTLPTAPTRRPSCARGLGHEVLLDEPLPPPPPDVPARSNLDTRGASTIREQLDKHRKLTTSASCHTRMDPLAALENFDVIGGWARAAIEPSEETTSSRATPPGGSSKRRDIWEYKLGSRCRCLPRADSLTGRSSRTSTSSSNSS